MAYRVQKVEQLIKDEVSLILLEKMRDSLNGMVTVTTVKLSPDLKQAKIYVSVLEADRRKAVMDKLAETLGMIRSTLASRIRLRFVPELKFFLDDTADYVDHLEQLFKQIRENDNKDEQAG